MAGSGGDLDAGEVRLYNELTVRDLEPIVLPLDEEYAEEDWNETL